MIYLEDESPSKNVTLSPTELEEIRRRCEAATEGPWDVCKYDGTVVDQKGKCYGEYVTRTHSRVDAPFIAHSRTDVPMLLAHIRELEGKLKVAEEALGWYSAKDTWRDSEADQLNREGGFFPYTLDECPIAQDGGTKASQALAAIREGTG